MDKVLGEEELTKSVERIETLGGIRGVN